jgi:biotin carboxyl carrier protein
VERPVTIATAAWSIRAPARAAAISPLTAESAVTVQPAVMAQWVAMARREETLATAPVRGAGTVASPMVGVVGRAVVKAGNQAAAEECLQAALVAEERRRIRFY